MKIRVITTLHDSDKVEFEMEETFDDLLEAGHWVGLVQHGTTYKDKEYFGAEYMLRVEISRSGTKEYIIDNKLIDKDEFLRIHQQKVMNMVPPGFPQMAGGGDGGDDGGGMVH